MIRQIEQGGAFVSNLRLQWLGVALSQKEEERPTVIQLLGDQDKLVDANDSKDVNVSKGFIWVRVSSSGHGNITDLDDTAAGRERRRKIGASFGDSSTIENLRRSSLKLHVAVDEDVEHVVFVLHGIRDMGDWTSGFEVPLQTAYLNKYSDENSKVYIHRAQYGYFGMGPFLLWEDRQKNVRWFMDQVTELKAEYPNLKGINVIAHSNGTYILASALENYAALEVSRAAFAGSVLRRDFPWSKYRGRIGAVRNYVGASDAVVGLLPCVFEKPGFKYINGDLGSAGFNGFTDHFALTNETRFVKGEHSAGLRRENMDSIVQFIVHGQKVDNPDIFVEEANRSALLEFLSKICWLLWILAFGLVVFGFIKVSNLAVWAMGKRTAKEQIDDSRIKWGARLVYIDVIYMILNTI